LQGYFAGSRGQPPLGQFFIRLSHPLSGMAALRTKRGRFDRGAHLGIGGHVLFQEPAGQFLAQRAGQLLPLREGDEGVLPLGVKHLLEGGRGAFKPKAAQASAVAWIESR
jgi:hypothetical protein